MEKTFKVYLTESIKGCLSETVYFLEPEVNENGDLLFYDSCHDCSRALKRAFASGKWISFEEV